MNEPRYLLAFVATLSCLVGACLFYPMILYVLIDPEQWLLQLLVIFALVSLVGFYFALKAFERTLNYRSGYFEANGLLRWYMFSNLALVPAIAIITGLYKTEVISGIIAVIYGAIVALILGIMIPVFSLLLGLKLKDCQDDLFGLKNPIRLSLFWSGIGALTLFLAEVAYIIAIYAYMLLAILFYKLYQAKVSQRTVSKVSWPTLVVAFLVSIVISVAPFIDPLLTIEQQQTSQESPVESE